MIGYLRTLWLFYRRHLRVQPMRELMAVAGVASGVALLFAVQVNDQSIAGSFEGIARGVAGRATLEVASRGPRGFGERIDEEIEALPGVKASAPLLETPVRASGPMGSRGLILLGATKELAALGGTLIEASQRSGEGALQRGLIVMTVPDARAIGAHPGDNVMISADAHSESIALDTTIPSSQLGPLADAPVAAAPLPIAQELTGNDHRLTRVLIESRPGREAELRATLERRFAATLNVRSVTAEPRLLNKAAAPEGELTALFSAISLAVAVTLGYSALLLASDERRRFVIYLIRTGTPDALIIASLALDALVLGIAGSLIGLLGGDLLSLLAFHALPGYLAAAFPLGSERIINWSTIGIAFGAGILAAFLAAALPAFAVLRAGATAEPGAVGRALLLTRNYSLSTSCTFAVGLTLIGAAGGASLAWPTVTIPALVVLLGGLILCLPMSARSALSLARRLTSHSGDPAARLAIAELRGSPARSVALAATGAVALFLTVQVAGSIADVQRAISAGAAQTGMSAQIWVRAGGAQNIYATQPFDQRSLLRNLKQQRAIASVLPQRGSFLDLPRLRIWVIGIPPAAHNAIAPVQFEHGSAQAAEARLREGGWAVASEAIAQEQHVRIGQQITLPTPSGSAHLRLAATVYNYGWPSGTVLVNAEQYAALWQDRRPSVLAIRLVTGVSAEQGKRAVEAALPAGSGLIAQTSAERQAEVRSVLGGTLARLNDTTTIVVVIVIIAVVSMMVAAVWQRRGRLDALISIGMSFAQLARLVFYEGGSMLFCGCVLGLGSGLLAQWLGDRWAAQVTNTQIRFAAAWQLGVRTILIAVGISLVAAMLATVRTVGFRSGAASSTE